MTHGARHPIRLVMTPVLATALLVPLAPRASSDPPDQARGGPGVPAQAERLTTCPRGTPPPSRHPAGRGGAPGMPPGLATTTVRDGYYDTPWPSEHADRWRTHAVAGGLPTGVGSDDLLATSAEVPPVPFWGYTRGDHVFVLGGSPAGLGFFADLAEGQEESGPAPAPADLTSEVESSRAETPYIAKIDTSSMASEILELPLGSTFNYNGGLLMHENGWMYAVARSVLYKVHPDNLCIADSRPLPLLRTPAGLPDPLTTYNGIQVRADGQLILKALDFTGLVPGGKILVIDPSRLRTRSETDSLDIGSARLTMAVEDHQELLYHSTPHDSIRFTVDNRGFEVDASWSATYRPTHETGTSQASSPVYMGGSDAVVFANNTLPFGVTEPMEIFSQVTTSDPAGPLTGQSAFGAPGAQVNFFMVAGDPFTSNVVAVSDQANGWLAGWKLGDDGELTRLWSTSAYRTSAGLAIAHDSGHLYVDDRRCDSAGENCTLWLVVLDLVTGDELAAIQVAGSQPSISQTFVGEDAVYLIATEYDSHTGYVTRVAVE